MSRRLVPLLLICLATLSSGPASAGGGLWSEPSTMSTKRYRHTASSLADGRVIVIGGVKQVVGPNGCCEEVAVPNVDVYDAATGAWTRVADLPQPRAAHSATVLPDGRVLVVGGHTGGCCIWPESTAFLYDPEADAWTEAATTQWPHQYHAAAMLQDGRVIVVGNAGTLSPATEIYDPATGTWTTPSQAPERLSYAVGVMLEDGRLLMVGDCTDTPRSSLYDPVADVWTTQPMSSKHCSGSATLLDDGRVLAAGGSQPALTAAAEIFDPATEQWQPAAPMTHARYAFALVTRADGTVLAAGGGGASPDVWMSAELYDPVADRWTLTDNMAHRRLHAAAARLPGGGVIVTGGYDTGFATAEIFGGPGVPVIRATLTHEPGMAHVGDLIEYQVVLTNETIASPVPALADVRLVSYSCDGAPQLLQRAGGDDDALLEESERWIYGCSHRILDHDPDQYRGWFRAQAWASERVVFHDVSVVTVILRPGLGLTLSGPSKAHVADVAEVELAVRNTGNTPLADVDASMDFCDEAPQYRDGDLDGDGRLALTEVWRYGCERVVRPRDPDPLVVLASARGADVLGGTGEGSASHGIDILRPDLTLTKVLSVEIIPEIDFDVRNTGDAPLIKVDVEDPQCDPTYEGGDADDDLVLSPGETWTFSCALGGALTSTATADAISSIPGGTQEEVDDQASLSSARPG